MHLVDKLSNPIIAKCVQVLLKVGSTFARCLRKRYLAWGVNKTSTEQRITIRRIGNRSAIQRGDMGIYEKNPIWDDVVPIAQDDGEGALAQIAYTDEYAEGKIDILRSLYKTHDSV